ncbi:MAG: hypothetical protein GY842_10430 [bacterium]|nr:hypothetical protein [bacterium]
MNRSANNYSLSALRDRLGAGCREQTARSCAPSTPLRADDAQPGPACGPNSARGTVLVMVVALLGMLFVMGVAFLSTVTFEARQIEAAVAARQESNGIEAVQAEIYQMLDAYWRAPGGAPYQMPAGGKLVDCIEDIDSNGICDDVQGDGYTGNDYKVLLPTYGELPFLHGVLAPAEPNLDAGAGSSTIPVLPYAGEIGPALKQEVATLRDYHDTNTGKPRAVRIDLNNVPQFATDADGDGIPDSTEIDLLSADSPITLPPDVRETLLEQLNDPAVSTNGGIYLSVRTVPHGAMADINWSHRELVYALFPDETQDWLQQEWDNERLVESYRTALEEPSLRNRGVLPPRRMYASPLHRDFEDALLGVHRLDPEDTGQGARGESTDYRWWLYAANTDESMGGNVPYWFEVMAAPSTVGTSNYRNYDRRHLLTTYSTDNLFMRDGTRAIPEPGLPGEPVIPAGTGWIESMLVEIDQPSIGPCAASGFGCWAIDDYPEEDLGNGQFGPLLDTDPRKGRIQVSLPYLERSMLGDPRDDPTNNGINSLQGRLTLPAEDNQRRARQFIRTIQDAFLLMLKNVDPSIPAFENVSDPDAEKERWAASLTANLIDFADADGLATQVQVVDVNGLAKSGEYVYGLERQPYITEVHTKAVDNGGVPDQANSYSAIELYNPYKVALTLSDFELEIDDGTGNPPTSYALSGTLLPAPTTGLSVPILGSGLAVVQVKPGVGGTNTPGWQVIDTAGALIEDGWTVRLTRKQAFSGVFRTIVVDEFAVNGTVGPAGPVATADFYKEPWTRDPDDMIEESVERAMWRVGSMRPSAFWTAVVPVTKPLPNSHSLGVVNTWSGATNFGYTGGKQIIRPVQVDMANSTNGLWSAFPSTGTLLLLMRHANSELSSGAGPFNTHLVSTEQPPNEWKRKEYQIDNGRMPVFDVAEVHRLKQSAASRELLYDLPMGYSFLPWGQYVFDYFTALPLDGEFEPTSVNESIKPRSDQMGARVYGRININAAPWTVLQGLPLVKWNNLPGSFQDTMRYTVYDNCDGNTEIPLGEEAARAIVAYREARREPYSPSATSLSESGDFSARSPMGNPNPFTFPSGTILDSTGVPVVQSFGTLRMGSGFLTVGELANVRHWSLLLSEFDPNFDGDETTLWRMDNGVVGRRHVDSGSSLKDYPAEDYVHAAGLLVALGDWTTTRSDVWTVYGVLRGNRLDLRDKLDAGGMSSDDALRFANERANQRAIFFQETIDRLPSLLNLGSPPARIGERTVGSYTDTR